MINGVGKAMYAVLRSKGKGWNNNNNKISVNSKRSYFSVSDSDVLEGIIQRKVKIFVMYWLCGSIMYVLVFRSAGFKVLSV